MATKQQKRRYLLLGATGKVGRMLLAFWQAHPPKDADIVPLSRKEVETEQLPCDRIIAAWGVTAGSREELAQNTELAMKAIELAQRCKAEAVLHFSTAGVYDPIPTPIAETAETKPPGEYGDAKLHMEAAIHECESIGVTNCCLRLCNVIGADSLFASIHSKPTITLHQFESGASPVRSYISVSDLARSLEDLCALQPAALPEVVNVAAPAEIEMADLARNAGRAIDFVAAPEVAKPKVVLDITKLQDLGIRAMRNNSAKDMIDDWQAWGTPK